MYRISGIIHYPAGCLLSGGIRFTHSDNALSCASFNCKMTPKMFVCCDSSLQSQHTNIFSLRATATPGYLDNLIDTSLPISHHSSTAVIHQCPAADCWPSHERAWRSAAISATRCDTLGLWLVYGRLTACIQYPYPISGRIPDIHYPVISIIQYPVKSLFGTFLIFTVVDCFMLCFRPT